MKLVNVRPELIEKAWPLVERWVTRALVRGGGDIPPAFVKAHLERGSMCLWLVWGEKAARAKGICITEFADSVRGKCCNLVVIAGHDFKRWKSLVEVIKAYARENGCVRLESGGRFGMVRYLKNDGWRPVRTVIELRL